MTGPAQYKGRQCSLAGPVPLDLAAPLGLNWGGHRVQVRRCAISPRGSSPSGNWALERRNDAVAHPAGSSGPRMPPDHCPGLGEMGRALDFCSSELTLWQLEGNQTQ